MDRNPADARRAGGRAQGSADPIARAPHDGAPQAGPVAPTPTSWWPARQRFAGLAVLSAMLTGGGAAAMAGTPAHAYGAAAYVIVTVAAVIVPAAIALQVAGGLALAGSLVLGQAGYPPLTVLPLVAGVAVTAELLAVVARLDSPMPCDPRDALKRTGLAAIIAGGVYGVVALIGELPGPTGLAALVLAAAACVMLAVVLASRARYGTHAG